MDNESTWARVWWRVTNEPAMGGSLFEALIGMAFAFGWIDWTGEQVGAVMIVVALLTGVSVRQTVVGPRKVGDVLAAAAHASEAASQEAPTSAGPTPTAEDLSVYFNEQPDGSMNVEHAGPQDEHNPYFADPDDHRDS